MELESYLEETGAILRGHFLLSSGRHSGVYFEKFRVLERPDVTARVVEEALGGMKALSPTVVVGPTTGGVVVAYEAARRLLLLSEITDFLSRGRRVALVTRCYHDEAARQSRTSNQNGERTCIVQQNHPTLCNEADCN